MVSIVWAILPILLTSADATAIRVTNVQDPANLLSLGTTVIANTPTTPMPNDIGFVMFATADVTADDL